MTNEEIVRDFRKPLEQALSDKADPQEVARFFAQMAGLNELFGHIKTIEPSDFKEILTAHGIESPLCSDAGQEFLTKIRAELKAILYRSVS